MGCSTSSLMWTTTTRRSSGWSQTPETSWASLGMSGCPSSRNGQRPRLPWSTTGRAAERGRALLERLVDRARENGISRFVAFIRSDNRRAVELMSHLGPPTSSLQGDLVELDIELPKQGIGAPLATALRAAAGTVLEVHPLAERVWRRAREMPGAARLRRPGGL